MFYRYELFGRNPGEGKVVKVNIRRGGFAWEVAETIMKRWPWARSWKRLGRVRRL